jgi:hypothetical protein
MNTRIIGVLFAALMCITMVAPAMAQPSPFVINGYVSDSGGSPCNGPAVQVTNLNTGASWDAENDSTSNYYKLVLDSDDVSAGDILRFDASGSSESKTVEHTVTQAEIDAGGLCDFNITLEAPAVPEPDLIVIDLTTPARLRADVINPITATTENIGSAGAGSFNVTLMVNSVPVDTASVTALGAGNNTTVEFLWTPGTTGNATLTVTADADDDVVESDETNNDLSEMVNVLDELTATVNVRIEGTNDTVWCGDVTFSSSVLVASDGSTHYLNEPTALGALDEADKLGGFGYVLENSVYGLYVPEINSEPPIGWNGWMYRVDYTSPWFGASEYTLYGGEDVLWYFGAWTAPPLAIELDRTTVITGEAFVATVTAYNDSTAAFDTVEAAEVYVDGTLYGLTGPDGTLTMSLAIVGDYQIHADKGTWADYTRSEKVGVTVTPPFTDTYDFTTGAGLDRWAYRYQTDAKPSAVNDVPGIEFMSDTNPRKDQYVKISTDNRKMQSDSTDLEGYHAAHRFVFDVTQPVEDILTIEVLWNGKGTNANRTVLQGATLYIRNGTGYVELASTTSKKEVYLSAELTEGFGNYIDANGYLTVLVEQNSAQTVKGKRSLVSKLSTDYVKVDITHT